MLGQSGGDIRYALRTLRARPGLSATIVATLAVAIGANTAIFTLVNEIVLRPLPIGDPAAVVDVIAEVPGGNSFTGFSYPDYEAYRERNDVLSGLAVFTGRFLKLGPPESRESASVQFVSAHYFDVLGVQPHAGRRFAPGDDRRGSDNAVAVVSHAFWQRRAGADPALLGSTLLLDGRPITVIGIGPAGFEGTFIGFSMEIWVPISKAEQVLTNFDLSEHRAQGLEMIGRLRPGVTPAQAQAALRVLAQQLEAEHPIEGQRRGIGVSPTTGIDHSMRSGVLGFLAVLTAVTGLVLLIACLNVGSLLLARSTTRRGEMAIRLALGAGRSRLARQLLTEILLLFAAAGALGLLLAGRLTQLLRDLVAASGQPIAFALPIDWRVASFTAAAVLAAALIAGLFPVREAIRQDPMRLLRAGGSVDVSRMGRLRRLFVVAQVAGAVTLLIGAGLLLRSLQEGMRLDPGFAADRVAVAVFQLDESKYDEARGRLFQLEAAERVSAIAGVAGVALAGRAPVGVTLSPVPIEVPGLERAREPAGLLVDSNTVGERYFDTLGIELLAGRGFSAEDEEGTGVAIVDESMAARFWPGRLPVGELFQVNGEPTRVVGVAADSRTLIQDSHPGPHLYLPIARRYSPRVVLLVSTAARPEGLQEPVRQAFQGLDPDLAAIDVRILRDMIDASLLPQRWAATITGALGGFGLLLAVLGLYALLSQTVTSRKQEIGIRMALGSDAGRILRLMMRSGLQLVAIGLALGLLASVALAPVLSSFLVGVGPADPTTLAAVTGLFLAVALLACFLPARRATRIDPIRSLRI